MATFVSGENSSIACIIDALNGNDESSPILTQTISKEFQDELIRNIQKKVDVLGIRFRRMIVNKTAYNENIQKFRISITDHKTDDSKEIVFWLDTIRMNKNFEKFNHFRTMYSSDEFYNALNDKLNQVFKETSEFIQNQLFNSEHKVKLIKAYKFINVYPKITFVLDSVYICAGVSFI